MGLFVRLAVSCAFSSSLSQQIFRAINPSPFPDSGYFPAALSFP
jgi:hypothetical protein